MKLVEMKCKNCGSTLKVEENAQSITCEYCHSTFMIDDEGKEAFEKIADTIESTHKSQNKIAIISSLIAVVFIVVFMCFVFHFGLKFMFNNTFERHSGSKAKLFVESLIDDAVTNNKKKGKHMLTVKFNDICTTDPDEIVEIKHSLKNSFDYEVSLDYDDKGYVSEITITEIGSSFTIPDDFEFYMPDDF